MDALDTNQIGSDDFKGSQLFETGGQKEFRKLSNSVIPMVRGFTEKNNNANIGVWKTDAHLS